MAQEEMIPAMEVRRRIADTWNTALNAAAEIAHSYRGVQDAAGPIHDGIRALKSDSPPQYVHAGPPAGWKLAPLEPTPEMLAAAAVAVLPRAAPADVALAKKAAPLVMMDGASGDESFEIVTATMATMPPFYRAMLAAAPDAPATISHGEDSKR